MEFRYDRKMNREKFEELVLKKTLSKNEEKILEEFRVKRAVIMAAGLGSRLRPLTYNTPKPLLTVNGVRIIDTIIDALLLNGIDDIYIIRGYLGEQFDVLLEKYPQLHMLNNFGYIKGNNILSACLAGNLIAGAYVMPADIYINNPSVFPKYQYSSNVLGYEVSNTEDWCIETDKCGEIRRLAPRGTNCYKDTGIFYWNTEEGLQLTKDIQEVCLKEKNWERYWSSVPFEIYKDHYHSFIRKCNKDDVIEIDTVEELAQLDLTYKGESKWV